MKYKEEDRRLVKEVMNLVIPFSQDEIWALSEEGLNEKRSEALQACRNVLNECERQDRELNAKEMLSYSIVMALTDDIQTGIRKQSEHAEHGIYRPDVVPGNDAGAKMFGKKNATWRNIFNRTPVPVADFRNLGEMLVAFHNGDPKIEQLRAVMTEGTGQDGGFSIPEELWAGIWDAGIEQSVTLDLVTHLPMKSNILNIPAWDSKNHESGPIAAVKGQWLGENVAATKVTPRLRTLAYTARKLAMFIAASSESLMDALALERSIAIIMKNSLAFELDEIILTGSGINRPLGVLSSPARIEHSRATSNSIAFADLCGMMGRVLPTSLDRVTWLCSPSAFNTLLAMVTSAGSGELVLGFRPGASDIKMSILGRPLRVTEKLKSLGTKGDLMLVDMSYYGLATRETGRFERTNAASWSSDAIDFRLIVRADGRPFVASPVTPSGSGSTLSPFVILD